MPTAPQAGEPVHGDGRRRPREEPLPGSPHGHPLGEHQDAAVEQGEHRAEHQRRGPGGQQCVREVGAGDRVPAAERPVRA
ncbi:hypothetical protein ACFU53_11295 [Streptomyces sp. NPDC057474]|uniref:hypothetical protein n=1 Tax=Streptomyces sp. NPDC057474 TaxID=3346144 RepID=UPI0036C6BD89